MFKKTTLIASFYLTSFSVFSADVPNAIDTGTITVKGTVHQNDTCTFNGGTTATVALPLTFTTDYKAKGDLSSSSSSNIIWMVCTGFLNLSGVYLSVDGTPDASDPTLFGITAGNGKATGVALKVVAAPQQNGTTPAEIPIVPNQESTVIKNYNGTSPQFRWTYKVQAVSVADTVTSGDLSTALTWTARYN